MRIKSLAYAERELRFEILERLADQLPEGTDLAPIERRLRQLDMNELRKARADLVSQYRQKRAWRRRGEGGGTNGT